MHRPQGPMPGDAVRLVGEYWPKSTPKGSIGIVEGVIGEPRAEYLVCFNAFAYRNHNEAKYSKYEYFKNKPAPVEIVSCSGGPMPSISCLNLKRTGETVKLRFWRWKGLPCAGGGEDYYLTVPVWDWNGKTQHAGGH